MTVKYHFLSILKSISSDTNIVTAAFFDEFCLSGRVREEGGVKGEGKEKRKNFKDKLEMCKGSRLAILSLCRKWVKRMPVLLDSHPGPSAWGNGTTHSQ